MPADFSRSDLSGMQLRSSDGEVDRGHFVEFYEDEATLVASITTFVTSGLADGDSAIVIAQPTRRFALEAEIDRSMSLRAAREAGRLVCLDAEETLGMFMDGERPDPERFDRAIGDIVGAVARPDAGVRAFGEMVAILWRQGNVAGAVALEDLWNRFLSRHQMSLLCAYPVDGSGPIDSELVAICDRHTHVLVPPTQGTSS